MGGTSPWAHGHATYCMAPGPVFVEGGAGAGPCAGRRRLLVPDGPGGRGGHVLHLGLRRGLLREGSERLGYLALDAKHANGALGDCSWVLQLPCKRLRKHQITWVFLWIWPISLDCNFSAGFWRHFSIPGGEVRGQPAQGVRDLALHRAELRGLPLRPPGPGPSSRFVVGAALILGASFLYGLGSFAPSHHDADSSPQKSGPVKPLKLTQNVQQQTMIGKDFVGATGSLRLVDNRLSNNNDEQAVEVAPGSQYLSFLTSHQRRRVGSHHGVEKLRGDVEEAGGGGMMNSSRGGLNGSRGGGLASPKERRKEGSTHFQL
eukprot:CAMPEP_0206379916 /NCGR_PEP_ID=MMETSP0294-20121207/11681_1 /ASSEMBLY_ACC=CAM_ASM_000327 /TAXON_ID=39354 /ORGANISM="Heterosigma akashiwo, Strain CCMP2393" /LENGTH=317 /DNA_ID=CAMNT_0053828961 /DNA_START=2105 /DNA_END=3059 /DNA_ORIENTATION=-